MSEQKNTKQNEQKMALSLIRSPEVRNYLVQYFHFYLQNRSAAFIKANIALGV
jgi:hypothetical protein